MKRCVSFLAAFLSVGFVVPGLAADDNLRVLPKLTPAQWREDVQFFARELPRRHANAFHHISRERFEAEVAQLSRHLDHLNGDEIYAGLDRIACLIGDGHTLVYFPADTAMMPLAIRQFADEFRVTQVAPGLETALGTRVVKVEGIPISRVHETLLALTPQDETPSLTHAQATRFLTLGMVLHGLGVTSNRRSARYTLADDTGREFTVDAHALEPDARPKWIAPYKTPPLFRKRASENFWFQNIPETRTIYCNFRSYKGLSINARRLLNVVDETSPDKLVIDVRQNGGGDYEMGLKHLVRPLRDRPSINKKGHLFLLIGPQTFSAAMSNSVHFRTQTAAILVGEPIGEKPNSYQESRKMNLPNSGLTVQYSIRFYKFVESGENLIRPDQQIIPTWSDYKSGRDPVLDWALNYQAK